MALPVSPLAPKDIPTLPPVEGVKLAADYAAIRYKTPRPDLLLVQCTENTTVAGVFTSSLTASAAVDHCRWALKNGGGKAQMLVVNSGNANAFTGKAGQEAVDATVAQACQLTGCAKEAVMVASTGVIGEVLPHQKITDALPELHGNLQADSWDIGARAILTTDTYSKCVTTTFDLLGVPITINGIAKGSGMIAPDMATMLAFIFTDAAIPSEYLQTMLARCNARSFNAITVDSDTSTSDTALLFATGKAENDPLIEGGEAALLFEHHLQDLMQQLAHLIVRDGEGASKFVTIEISGAENDAAAKRIGLSVANSPLVKTALAGCDPNWGRIVMAVGKAGERADRDKLAIWIGEVMVAQNGCVHPDYQEAPTAEYMQGDAIRLAVDVGVGNGNATVWTCDFTKRYIEINADYRS